MPRTRAKKDTDLGTVLRDARSDAGLTQKQLAEKVGKGQTAVCGWENNHARPSTRTLSKIAIELGLDIGALALLAAEPVIPQPRGNGRATASAR